MLACVDVDYREHEAVAACLWFRDWPDAASSDERVVRLPPAAPYVPGQFYERELPCLLAALRSNAEQTLDVILIDSYVWLDGSGKPGLGAHLYEALGRQTPVIGVAKTSFARSPFAALVHRGSSQSPLYITAAGLPIDEAADCVQRMHGSYRIPTLLKRVDRLCRDA